MASRTRRHRKRSGGKERNTPVYFGRMASTRAGGARTKTTTSKGYSSRSSETSLVKFQEQITIKFLETLMMIKLYHWKTFSYATHKATDDLYASLNDNVDKFMEVLFGKTLRRSDLTKDKSISLIDLTSPEELKDEIVEFKTYLVDLDQNKAMQSMSNSDLYNIRDEILADLNKFMYLLTLK